MKNRLLLCLLIVVLGAGAWAAGQLWLAQINDVLCSDVAIDHGYNAWSTSGDLLPPSYQCTLFGPHDSSIGASKVVDVTSFAVTRLLVTIGIPIVVAGAVLAVAFRPERARSVP